MRETREGETEGTREVGRGAQDRRARERSAASLMTPYSITLKDHYRSVTEL
jgi:hypothetical protein